MPQSDVKNKPLTMADIENASRAYAQLRATNKIELSATVVRKYQSEPRARMKDGLPVHDKDGNPLFYEPTSKVTVSFTGGEKEIPVSASDYLKLQEGLTYMFRGRFGVVRNFGQDSIDVVFHSFEEI